MVVFLSTFILLPIILFVLALAVANFASLIFHYCDLNNATWLRTCRTKRIKKRLCYFRGKIEFL